MTQNVSITQMASIFVRAGVAMPMASREAIEKAADMVLEQIRSEPGEYQTGAGPFASWAPLALSTLADKAYQGLPSPSPELRTGDLRDSYEKTIVSNHKAEVGSDSDVAVYQELGTSKMPPRSIIGLAAAKKEHEIWQITGRLFFGVLTSPYQAGGFKGWTGSGTHIPVPITKI
jgi:hypothetical protein